MDLTRDRSSTRLRAGWLVPFFVTLAARLALALALPITPAWDGVIYARAAEQIARGAGFTRMILAPGQPPAPTAFYPVGLPAVLAPLHLLELGPRADLALQCLFGSLVVPIAYALARRVAGRRAAVIAAWLSACWPGGVLLSLSWMTEPSFLVPIGLAIVVVAWSRRRRRALALATAAVLASLAAYIRPTALPILAIVAIGLAFVDRAERGLVRGVVSNLALVALVAVVVLSPWATRNAAALGAAVPVSTNGGYNLLVGTFGEGSYDAIPAHADCPHGLGEIAKDSCRTRLALSRIRESPGDAIARGLLKLTHTFGHESAPAEILASSLDVDPATRDSVRWWTLGICRAFWLGLLAAALAGALAHSRRRRRIDAVDVALFAPIAATALLHALTIGGDRYHTHLVPAFVACAAITLRGSTRTVAA
jgi:hypothetical protein